MMKLGWFLGLFAVLPVFVGTIFLFTHLDDFTNYAVRDFNMAERLMTQLHVVVIYLKMILLPRLSDMTLFHDYLDITRSFDLVTGLLLAMLCGAIFLVFFLYRRAPVISFAIAWFLTSHLLESTFFSLELMFEHRNYLASVGPLLAVVYYLFNIPPVPELKYLSVVIVLLVAFLTFMRVQEWRSAEMIYQIAVIEHPDSARANTEMANLKYSRGDIDGALEHMEVVKEQNPYEFGPMLHEIALRCGSGTEIQHLLDEAIIKAQSYPVSPYSLNAIDNLLVMLNENICPELVLDDLISVIEAAERQPVNQLTTTYIGFLERAKGQIYLLKGDFSKGIEYAFSSYEKTGITSILENLGRNLIQLNLLGDAEQVLLVLENINNESGGREMTLVVRLREALRQATQRQVISERLNESREQQDAR